MNKLLQHQLNELAALKRAPVLWREQNRARLLKSIENSYPQPYSLGERLFYHVQNFRLALAPMHLAPVLTTLLIMLVSYAPLTSALAVSLPGSPLYPIKRAVEKFELSLRSSSDSQGLFYLTLANRRLSEAKTVSEPAMQAALLRDYNINLGFAAASLETGLPSQELAKAYDQATDFLAADLKALVVDKSNRQVYKAAVSLTDKVSSRALALLVSQHTDNNGLKEDDVALRLAAEINKMEAKLENVEVKVKAFPSTKPAPRVVLSRPAAVVPVAEAQALAKANLTEARQLVAQKQFSLALKKVQESEDLTIKSEEAVAQDELTKEAVESGLTTQPDPNTEGEVKKESLPEKSSASQIKTEIPSAEAGGAGEVLPETNTIK